ncbi:hypothetical protein NEFER03_1184 [Nematocida sp. LUAm3]|nr:hypothetical protein NEFER03_1184 [Nematocida sp. LUAm3]KAI5175793.1 hypothetical protein NEFER02_1662 [Nematocida sp. LUAm2]KAI5178289.1 hypothetical protein NEFER01_1456 [Nematocida sp. LUAm1]
MQKIRNNRGLFKITISIVSCLLVLDLSRAAFPLPNHNADSELDDVINQRRRFSSSFVVSPSNDYTNFSEKKNENLSDNQLQESPVAVREMPAIQHDKPPKFTFNSFSKENLSKVYKHNYPIYFTSRDEFLKECKRIFIPSCTLSSEQLDHFLRLCNKHAEKSKLHQASENGELIYFILLRDLLRDVLEENLFEQYNVPSIDITTIISVLPHRLTGKEAAAYIFYFINIVQEYLNNAEYYIKTLKRFQDEDIPRDYNLPYTTISSAKKLVNLLFAHNQFIEHFQINPIGYKYILSRIQFSSEEKKNLLRYYEIIFSYQERWKNNMLSQYASTQSRLKETQMDISSGCTLILNCNCLHLFASNLVVNEHFEFFKRLFFVDHDYKIVFDKNLQQEDEFFDEDLQQEDEHTSSCLPRFSSKLPTPQNSIIPVSSSQDSLCNNFVDFILLCGSEGIIKILPSLTYIDNSSIKPFIMAIKSIHLNKGTKVVFTLGELSQLEGLSDKGYKKLKTQRENDLVDLTKSKKNSIPFIGFSIFTTISIFVLPLLSLVSTTAGILIPILLPVIIFAFALYTIYTLSLKENKKRRTSLLRGIPIAAIAFLGLYIISTFVITDMNGNPLILKTVQLLLLSEFSLVVLFGLITSCLIVKNRSRIRKRFGARLAFRIAIYALSILLLLLPFIMILIGHKTDAMLLIRSNIMIFSSILFFIGSLLEDQNYNDFELQVKRKRTRIVTWMAIALFVVSFIVCVSTIHNYSLNKPFDAVTEVTKDSSFFYRFFSSLPRNFYSTSMIPNTP